MITAKIRRTHRNTAKTKMPPAQSAAIAAPIRPINSANTATTVATMHRPRIVIKVRVYDSRFGNVC